MIRHVWTVFCSSSAIDRDTNQVSLFDLIEQIRVQLAAPPPAGEKAVVPAQFQVVTLWTRGDGNEAESAPTRLRLVTPNGHELLKSENNVDLTEHQFRRVRLNLAGMPYVGDGRYHFLVDLRDGDDWRVVADVPVQFEVVVQLPTAEPANPAG
jgi:hypothetical protein